MPRRYHSSTAVRTVLSGGISNSDTIIGVVGFKFRHGHEPGEQRLGYIMLVGSMIGQAMRRAQLLDEQRRPARGIIRQHRGGAAVILYVAQEDFSIRRADCGDRHGRPALVRLFEFDDGGFHGARVQKQGGKSAALAPF